MTEPFWYVDDEHHVRWAVRVSRGWLHGDEPTSGDRVVFTSAERQISTESWFSKEQSLLTRSELLELLSRAKGEAVSGYGFALSNHDPS